MTIVGKVQKVSNGSKPYVARYADGTPAGYFQSVGEAKKPIVAASGTKYVVWTRDDLPGGVERYVATVP